MHISFTLNKQDSIALQKVVGQRLTELSGQNSKLYFANIVAWIPIGVSLSAVATLYRSYPDLTSQLTIAISSLITGAFLLSTVKYYREFTCRKILAATDGWFFSEQKISLDENGISANALHCSAQYRWSSFRHLTEDERNLYLFVDNAQALILPKHALRSPDAIQQIKSWLKNKS